jgi:hypothetical protein
MNATINSMVSAEHVADLRRAAARHRLFRGGSLANNAQVQQPTVALRLAYPDESRIVRDLAALDDAPALQGQVLLALLDGQVVAALSLLDGRIIANPFVPTADAVALLRVRADHLGPSRSFGRARSIFRQRLAPRFS